jgi:hypothetical protein
VSQKNKKQEESHSKQDMLKISKEARCQQLTGQIVKNGKQRIEYAKKNN